LRVESIPLRSLSKAICVIFELPAVFMIGPPFVSSSQFISLIRHRFIFYTIRF
jgi:hypothetical protein